MKKLTALVAIVLASLAVSMLASGGTGCCSIPRASAPSAQRTAVTTLHIEGMTCGSCATAVRHVLTKIDGVAGARVSYENKNAVVTYDPAKVTGQTMVRAIEEKLPTYKATVVKR